MLPDVDEVAAVLRKAIRGQRKRWKHEAVLSMFAVAAGMKPVASIGYDDRKWMMRLVRKVSRFGYAYYTPKLRLTPEERHKRDELIRAGRMRGRLGVRVWPGPLVFGKPEEVRRMREYDTDWEKAHWHRISRKEFRKRWGRHGQHGDAPGALLGYPACCIRAFSAASEKRWKREERMKRKFGVVGFARHTKRKLEKTPLPKPWWPFYILWTPCSRRCRQTEAWGREMQRLLEENGLWREEYARP